MALYGHCTLFEMRNIKYFDNSPKSPLRDDSQPYFSTKHSFCCSVHTSGNTFEHLLWGSGTMSSDSESETFVIGSGSVTGCELFRPSIVEGFLEQEFLSSGPIGADPEGSSFPIR